MALGCHGITMVICLTWWTQLEEKKKNHSSHGHTWTPCWKPDNVILRIVSVCVTTAKKGSLIALCHSFPVLCYCIITHYFFLLFFLQSMWWRTGEETTRQIHAWQPAGRLCVAAASGTCWHNVFPCLFFHSHVPKRPPPPSPPRCLNPPPSSPPALNPALPRNRPAITSTSPQPDYN